MLTAPAQVQDGPANTRPIREVRVGLLGYGCVGSAVDRLLAERQAEIEQTHGIRVTVVRALVRDVAKPRARTPRAGVLTTDFRRIADDASIDIAVEVMGGLVPTERYVRELLAAGKPVVSANKQLLARRGANLARVAAAQGVPLRFEAAVGGAIPIIRTLCEALAPGTVQRITGVVNGTTNYLLTQVEQGHSFAEALDEAQRLGYAEANPSEDLSGLDAAAKIAILATLAFQRPVTLEQVECTGIESVREHDVHAARSAGKHLRLIGKAAIADGAVTARVAPTAIAETDPLAHMPGAFNEIVLEGDAFGMLALRGMGAGGLETATAVVGDVLALAAAHPVNHLDRFTSQATVDRYPRDRPASIASRVALP